MTSGEPSIVVADARAKLTADAGDCSDDDEVKPKAVEHALLLGALVSTQDARNRHSGRINSSIAGKNTLVG